MAPITETDFDQFLLQISMLRNDVGEASSSQLSLDKRAALRDSLSKRLDSAGELAIGDPSLWVG